MYVVVLYAINHCWLIYFVLWSVTLNVSIAHSSVWFYQGESNVKAGSSLHECNPRYFELTLNLPIYKNESFCFSVWIAYATMPALTLDKICQFNKCYISLRQGPAEDFKITWALTFARERLRPRLFSHFYYGANEFKENLSRILGYQIHF